MATSSNKWKASYDSNRKYNPKWEKTYVWLKKASDGSEAAFCQLCHCTILPKISNLTKHEKSEKHRMKTPSKSQTQLDLRKIPSQTDDKVKEAELQIAVSMTCHCAIRTIDHLSEIMIAHGQGSTLGHIKLHRTKCTYLIKNIISPSLKTDLLNDFQNMKYAIIIDESTDVSTQKHLCILIRFLSDRQKKILTGFLGLIPVQEATGENLFNLIEEEIKTCGQSLTNCIGFASDGASNMVGCNNSVWSRLKDVSPFCVQLKCICHSLALCIQQAVSKLPSNIGFLLSEIPQWFRRSQLRREAYKDLFKIMNTATEFESTRTVPLPFEKPSSTRWLVRGKVMFTILMNWEELKTYFTSAELAQSKFETKFKARLLKEIISDHKNYLFFVFVTPIVQEFERLNSFFQQTKADPHELYQELFLHQKSLQNRLYDVNGQKRNIQEVDFGIKFLTECNKFLQQNDNTGAHLEIRNVKERCMSMLEEALSQVTCRLPSARDTFRDLSNLSPMIILNQLSRATFSDLPFIHLAGINISTVEEQYRKLPFVDWKEEAQFKKDGLPTDSEQFWIGVLQHQAFKELATYALTCLITPVSNAVVERIFSLVSSVKTKARNRMQLNLLDAIVRIRAELLLSKKCCKDFRPSSKMLKNFTSDKVYVASPNFSSVGGTDELDLEFFLSD